MIRKLRIRFIAVATLAAAIVITAVSCGILLTNRQHNMRSINGMLTLLVQNEGRFPEAKAEQAPEEKQHFSKQPFQDGSAPALHSPETPFRTRFFTAVTDAAGEILHLNTDNLASLSEDEARAYVHAAILSGKDSGKRDIFYYRIASDTNDDTRRVIVFLNCEVELASMRTLSRICILFAMLSILLVTLLSFLLSGSAIRPFALNIARQKEFVTDAGHELKMPIAVIQSNVEVIELNEGESKWTRNIRSQSERLIRLANQLTMLAREDEDVRLTMTAVDLSSCIRRAVAACEERAALRAIPLCTEIANGITVQGDREKLDTLCSVLLDNAIKYASGGTITCTLRKKNDKAVLTCSNQCAPLGKTQLSRLFDRFYRADTARGNEGGFGLGLSLATAVVRTHGGRISASQSADGLLTFTVIL